MPGGTDRWQDWVSSGAEIAVAVCRAADVDEAESAPRLLQAVEPWRAFAVLPEPARLCATLGLELTEG
jgi:hypothetical protein